MTIFLSGMITMGFVIASLFFFRFWWRTRDMLFVYFGVAFCLLAISQALNAIAGIPGDDQAWIYLLRFVAFALLIVGIVAKNVGDATRKRSARER
jgi:hypothetical protein